MADRSAIFGVLTTSAIAGTIAESLHRYTDDLPEDSSRDIRGVFNCLLDIKAILRDLDLAFQDPRFNRSSRELLDDIELGIGSCSRSLRELDVIVARYTSGRRLASARRAWYEIQESFHKADGYALVGRLEVHKTFLLQLKGILQFKNGTGRTETHRTKEKVKYHGESHERAARQVRDMEDHRRRYPEEKTYVYRCPAPVPSPPYDAPQQQRRTYVPPGTFPPTPPMEPQRRSFTPGVGLTTSFPPTPPMEPLRYHHMSSPHGSSHGSTHGSVHGSSHGSPHGSVHGSRPMSPETPMTPPSRYAPPPAPSPMSSPAGRSRGSGGLGSALAAVPGSKPSWWNGISDVPAPGNVSPVSSGGSSGGSSSGSRNVEGSQCFGMPMDSLSMAREEIEIIKVEFDNDLTLRLYRDESSDAAKVVCTIGPQFGVGSGDYFNQRSAPNKFQTFIDASLLTVSRAGSSLHLKRRGIMWACLYFTDIENMVLFYHTFLALRFNGPNAPSPKKSEYWLDGEELLFSAEIDDAGYPHLLRVLRDRDSGVVRLASANVEGEFTDSTVWTAFITDYIGQPEWMHCSRSNKIVLRTMRQFAFTDYFDTNTWKNFELRFMVPGDAKAFETVINELRVPAVGGTPY
ncbi:uncharacterized protein LAJ45_09452 [Morchella importuna]|uniref:uncharacterized protein n=1 Tax=Morchella importuna TaxID=1174673 RepID=UPI001E8DEC49|nr:uncharacterized protein LAJ45_09452 [Morchella importuna]KAH8146506.1 hypothetical protein LAJ45_09452 [Morchella importuna]